MATGPKIATSPLEILTNDGTREPPIVNKYWGPVVGGGAALVVTLLTNWATKKPFMSGLQLHVLGVAAGATIGKIVDDYRNDFLAERDAVFRHYIELHPEDFPDFDRKKYAEVLQPWVPIR
ncbi:hypothetical protein MTP99_012568 [Tenebrio molitor]|jgi:NADH dehydrogenase (ubiquinone) 1 subunit C2|nr:hypothetical protein MTP99_012568 [Tenebrio molitor]CAH1371075.1 unnamed protein product [Tenebrio molitor]